MTVAELIALLDEVEEENDDVVFVNDDGDPIEITGINDEEEGTVVIEYASDDEEDDEDDDEEG